MKKRSVRISGHPTSITLEEPFWDALKSLAKSRNISIAQLVSEIDAKHGEGNLSSAIRVHILQHHQKSSKS